MLTPIADRLIYNLRHDPHTRNHFDMSTFYEFDMSCGTMGCIAGTAVVMCGKFTEQHIRSKEEKGESDFFITQGMELLGIPFRATALDLFLPNMQIQRLVAETQLHFLELNEIYCEKVERSFDYLPTQARPDLETIAKMKEIANLVWQCARKELPFSGPDSLCSKVQTMGYSINGLYEMVAAVRSELSKAGV